MKTIGIIGAGNLGKRLTQLICRNNLQNFLVVSDRNREKMEEITDTYDLDKTDNEDTIKISDILFLTVKPGDVEGICKDINEHYQYDTPKIIISAAAGVPVENIKKWTNNKHTVVRCMPNIPISEKEGSIVWYSENINTYDVNFINDIITQGPENIWVNKENLVDVATVVSGCGPAYIAKFFQTYTDIGEDMGFSREQSLKLIQSSFLGTAKLLLKDSAESIIDDVASKGGATEKGLEMLDKDGFTEIIRKSAFSSLERIDKITKSLN